MKGHEGEAPVTIFPDDYPGAILGHELGNVLNGLLGMTELLAESGLDPEQRRWLEAIRHAGLQMHSLIAVCSRWRSGGKPGFEPRIARIDGIDLLEQVITSHAPAARERMNRLVLLTDPQLPRHWNCDACLVRQLLDNLLDNAARFTARGEIVIEASATRADQGSNTFELRVSDTGPGIVDAVAESLFEPYLGTGKAGGDSAGNQGLGLYICREITRAMGGQITCLAPADSGARFLVSLPGVLRRPEPVKAPWRNLMLSRVSCRLELDGPVRRSVKNFLLRLGVRPHGRKPAHHRDPRRTLVLNISEAPGPAGAGDPGLLLTPMGVAGVDSLNRTLPAPVLESSLGTLLLEMALEWRASVRSGKPG